LRCGDQERNSKARHLRDDCLTWERAVPAAAG